MFGISASGKDIVPCVCSFRLGSTTLIPDSYRIDDFPLMPCTVAAAFIRKFNDPITFTDKAGLIPRAVARIEYFKCEHRGVTYEETQDHPSHVAAKIELFAQNSRFKPTLVKAGMVSK